MYKTRPIWNHILILVIKAPGLYFLTLKVCNTLHYWPLNTVENNRICIIFIFKSYESCLFKSLYLVLRKFLVATFSLPLSFSTKLQHTMRLFGSNLTQGCCFLPRDMLGHPSTKECAFPVMNFELCFWPSSTLPITGVIL